MFTLCDIHPKPVTNVGSVFHINKTKLLLTFHNFDVILSLNSNTGVKEIRDVIVKQIKAFIHLFVLHSSVYFADDALLK
jgi:hypothetical protein